MQIKLTAQHCTLLVAMLHYIAETAEDIDEDTRLEVKSLGAFFAAVALEPWKFPAGPTLPPRILPGDEDTWENEGGS